MSINLVFKTNNGYIDFPFQTPTALTEAVLVAKNDKQRLKLIDEAMQKWEWDKAYRKERLDMIRDLLKQYPLGIV